jgi:hypothetical protein
MGRIGLVSGVVVFVFWWEVGVWRIEELEGGREGGMARKRGGRVGLGGRVGFSSFLLRGRKEGGGREEGGRVR